MRPATIHEHAAWRACTTEQTTDVENTPDMDWLEEDYDADTYDRWTVTKTVTVRAARVTQKDRKSNFGVTRGPLG